MADQQRGSILRSGHFDGSVDIVGQRCQRVLHREDAVAFFMQGRNDMPPV
jgi:hypothetical protein